MTQMVTTGRMGKTNRDITSSQSWHEKSELTWHTWYQTFIVLYTAKCRIVKKQTWKDDKYSSPKHLFEWDVSIDPCKDKNFPEGIPFIACAAKIGRNVTRSHVQWDTKLRYNASEMKKEDEKCVSTSSFTAFATSDLQIYTRRQFISNWSFRIFFPHATSWNVHVSLRACIQFHHRPYTTGTLSAICSILRPATWCLICHCSGTESPLSWTIKYDNYIPRCRCAWAKIRENH